MQESILLVEDDDDLVGLLREPVEQLGYTLDRAADGQSGLELALAKPYALIILDVNLPRLGGFEVCKRLRVKNPDVPVIMLTAQSSEVDKVLGLELGADDYVTKPFSLRELVARINARLRPRSKREEESGDLLSFGELKVGLGARQAWIGKREIELTPLEFDILAMFVSNPGRSISRDAFVEQVWGGSKDELENTVTIAITRLRRKLGESSRSAKYITTVRGHGYRFLGKDEGAPQSGSPPERDGDL